MFALRRASRGERRLDLTGDLPDRVPRRDTPAERQERDVIPDVLADRRVQRRSHVDRRADIDDRRVLTSVFGDGNRHRRQENPMHRGTLRAGSGREAGDERRLELARDDHRRSLSARRGCVVTRLACLADGEVARRLGGKKPEEPQPTARPTRERRQSVVHPRGLGQRVETEGVGLSRRAGEKVPHGEHTALSVADRVVERQQNPTAAVVGKPEQARERTTFVERPHQLALHDGEPVCVRDTLERQRLITRDEPWPRPVRAVDPFPQVRVSTLQERSPGLAHVVREHSSDPRDRREVQGRPGVEAPYRSLDRAQGSDSCRHFTSGQSECGRARHAGQPTHRVRSRRGGGFASTGPDALGDCRLPS